nr:caspase family protein [Candidatus Sigynarchaeota archaeon]
MKLTGKQLLKLSFFVILTITCSCLATNRAIYGSKYDEIGPKNTQADDPGKFQTVMLKQATDFPSGPDDIVDAYALVIGISDYPGTDNDLNYCDDDAVDVSAFIEDRFGVSHNHVWVLKDNEATYDNIYSALSTIESYMDSNDYFFFFYSGHGSAGNPVITTWSVQSSHPYSNYMDSYWHKSVPGAAMMCVHFVRIETEYGYDAVFVGDNYDRAHYYDVFSGTYTNIFSYWVPTDDIYVNLYSDNIYTDWGFQVDYVESLTYTAPYKIIPYDGMTTGMSGTALDTLFDSIPGTVIGVFDSCFSGGVGSDVSASGRYVMTACMNDEFSLDDSASRNGVFTNAFLNAWETSWDSNDDGVLSFEEVFGTTYNSAVARSTAMDSPFHPVEFDNITGDTILETNAKIVTLNSDAQGEVDISYFLNGLGYGDLSCTLYDVTNERCVIAEICMGMLTTTTEQYANYSLADPGFPVSAVVARLTARYHANLETSYRSFNLAGATFSSSLDSDNDGVRDSVEYSLGMNPWANDSDADGINDGNEIDANLNPLINDADYDYDDDGLPNDWEAIYGLDPYVSNQGIDTDHDRLNDVQEYVFTTDPTDPDSDDDFLSDYDEYILHTNPHNTDTDGDLFMDGVEQSLGNDPRNALNSPVYHYFAFGLLFALPLFVVITSKRIKKDIKRPAPPTSRPLQKSERTQRYPPQQRSTYVPSTYQSPSSSLDFAPVQSRSTPSYPAFMPGVQDIESFLPYDLRRKLDALPPYQREFIKQLLVKQLQQKILEDQTRARQAQSSKYCIRCGAPMIGGRCISCGYMSPF